MSDPTVLPTERLEHEITTLAAQLAAATCRWLLWWPSSIVEKAG